MAIMGRSSSVWPGIAQAPTALLMAGAAAVPERNDLRLVYCRTASRLNYLLYVTRGLLRRNWRIPGIDLAYSTRISCQYLQSSTAPHEPQPKIYLEADGELLGTLPAEITVAPEALTLLAPSCQILS